MNRRQLGLLIAVAAIVAVLYGLADYLNDWPGSSPEPFAIAATALVGVSYLAAGVVAWHHRPSERIGLLFMLVGLAWFLPAITNLRSPFPFIVGNLLGNLYQSFLAYLALAWPSGYLRSRRQRIVVAEVFVTNFVESLASILFWNPQTDGCGSACPANPLLIDGSTRIYNTVDIVVGVVGLAVTLLVVALVVQNWRSASGYARREMNSLLWVAVPVVAYIVILSIVSNFNLDVPNVLLNGIAPLLLVFPPVAFLVGLARARLARGTVGSALVDLEPGPPPRVLRDTLAAALGDSTLQLAFRMPAGGYHDTAETRLNLVDLGPGRAVMGLDPEWDAVLVYDARLGQEPRLVKVAVSVASLALQHSRLQAEVNEQLDQVRASRERIVEAGDTARRRLERDLHDGAQQRLVTLNLALAMARDRATGADPELETLLDSASKEAKEALVELRELARGIHPAVLTETGLCGAVEALVERSLIATTVTTVPSERFPAPIEATAYFVVCEALTNVAKHAAANSATIAIVRSASVLSVRVDDDGIGGARPDRGSGLRGLADRVASIGGSLRIESPSGAGTHVEAEIPCP
jgi:signal transduction histidine kinase